jgi:hypothetical protein
MPDARETE